MKKTVSLIIFLSLATLGSLAQNCLRYYPVNEGSGFELTTFNRKDKVLSRTTYTVLSQTDHTITYRGTVYDKKDEEVGSVEFDIYCEGDTLKVDMRNFLSADNLEQMNMEGVEVEMESIDMVFPAILSVGQQLPDASFTLKVFMGEMPLLTTNVHTINRKVEGEETITTPLGTFECFVISSDATVKMGFINTTTRERIFIHIEEGFLRSESFNKKGKLESYTLRTK